MLKDSSPAFFAGAIGSYKNPHSHRKVAIEAEDAVEMLMLASHLCGLLSLELLDPFHLCAMMASGMDQNDSTPKQLQPAVEHIKDVFDESDWKCSWITQHLCCADLHAGATKEDDLAQYRSAFADLRTIVGPSISKQFELTFRIGTPSAIFHAYAEMYRKALDTAVRDMLAVGLQIAINNPTLVKDDPVRWAKALVHESIENGHHRFAMWIKNVCDVQPFMTHTPITEEDQDEMIYWRKWRAPRFIRMRPSANTPFDASTAWTREDEVGTTKILDSLSKRFTQYVELALDDFVGRAYVQLAKKGLAADPQHESVQDIRAIDAIRDHKFARMAVEEARKSVAEDGRTHPLVGRGCCKRWESTEHGP